MRVSITYICYLIGIAIFFMAIAGCTKKQKTDPSVVAIEAVLKQDKQISADLTHRINQGYDFVESVELSLNRMRQIDTSKCPTDFNLAWLKHCQSWQDLLALLQSEPKGFVNQFLTGFVNGLGGKLDGGYGEMVDKRQRLLQLTRETYYEVERIAVNHGARLPN